MKSHVLHTVWCNISGEAAGEIWNWSLLGVRELTPSFHSFSIGSCPWPCPAQCAPMCSPLCCRGYGRQQTFPSYRGASFYPQAAAYLPRPKPRQTFVPPPPPPPPPPRAPLYFSPQANQQMSFYSQPRQPLPLPPPPPPPPSCPGACSKNCYPACTKSCCNPPPPPPCPWYCPKSCYPQCGEACCKPKPPPMPLYLKRSEMNAVACEEHKLKLRCPNKYDRIVLYSTFYGRKEDGVCKHDFIPSKGKRSQRRHRQMDTVASLLYYEPIPYSKYIWWLWIDRYVDR